MRIEAGVDKWASQCDVYHAELCKILRNVKWVDDETNQYGIATLVGVDIKQARRIVIPNPLPGTIIINPLEDCDDTQEDNGILIELVGIA